MSADDSARLIARQTVLEEITFRMNKLWRIFSWASTVLTALIGGTVALRTNGRDLPLTLRGVLAGVAVVLAVYSVFWLRQNLRLERQARDALALHDEALAIDTALPRPDKGNVIGYSTTVVLLALAVTVAAFVPLR